MVQFGKDDVEAAQIAKVTALMSDFGYRIGEIAMKDCRVLHVALSWPELRPAVQQIILDLTGYKD